MDTFLLLGAYGQNNLGDDALLEVFLAELGEARLIVNSAQPDQTSARYGVAAVATYTGLPRMRRLRALWRADAIVFGGGSLLKEIEGSHLKRLLYFVRIFVVLAVAKLLRRPTAMLAVGMGPLKGRLYRHLARVAAEATDLVTVRDSGSRELLLSIGVRTPVHVTADPALLLAAEAPEHGPSPAPTVVVVPRYSLTATETGALAAACDHLVERHGARVEIVVFQTGYRAIYDDRAAAELLRGRMRCADHARIVVPETPAAALATIGAARLVLSARLHALIFAAATDVAPVGLDYEVKVGNFMGELGLGADCVSLPDLAAGRLPATLDRILARRPGLPPVASTRVQALRQSSRASFELFTALLARRAGRRVRSLSRRWRTLLLLGIGGLLLLMWQAAHAKTPTFSHPAQEQARLVASALRDSEADKAAGAYIPGFGAVFEADLIRGPNSLKDKPPYWGVHDWAFYLMGTFGPQLTAVPPDETIAISIDYYDYDNRVYQQFVITSRAGDIADASTYQIWLGGVPFAEAVARIEGQPEGAAPAAPQPTPAPAASASFDFDDATTAAADWRAAGGTWQPEDSGFAQTETERYDLLALLQRQIGGDYRFQADVKLVAGAMGGGIVFNAPDGAAKNGAQMISYSEQGAYLQWGGFDDTGAFKFVGGSPVASGGDGAWHTLAVAVAGSSYAVSLDGAELVRDVPLGRAAGGYVGLFASTSHVVFDNVKLELMQP